LNAWARHHFSTTGHWANNAYVRVSSGLWSQGSLDSALAHVSLRPLSVLGTFLATVVEVRVAHKSELLAQIFLLAPGAMSCARRVQSSSSSSVFFYLEIILVRNSLFQVQSIVRGFRWNLEHVVRPCNCVRLRLVHRDSVGRYLPRVLRHIRSTVLSPRCVR